MFHHAAAVLTVHLLDAREGVARRLAGERGQGTVEYVGLILLVAGVLAAVVLWARQTKEHAIGDKVVKQLKDAIDQTASKGK
jgi:hypothetical protein